MINIVFEFPKTVGLNIVETTNLPSVPYIGFSNVLEGIWDFVSKVMTNQNLMREAGQTHQGRNLLSRN